jgi:hypothetical protein
MRDYNLSESRAGFDWIDGRRVFQKTIDFGALPQNATKAVPHGIEGLDRLVKPMEFVTKRSTDGAGFSLPHVHSHAFSNGVQSSWNLQEVIVRTQGDYDAYDECYVTIFYVKV